MSRLKPSNSPQLTLAELIPIYAENKFEMDSYKALCEKEKAEIKQLMTEQHLSTCVVGKYKAKKSISTTELIDEDRLLDICKAYNLNQVVKTKEYVDMDALENYLYKNPNKDLMNDIDSCRTSKETVKLLLSIVKEDAENE